MSAALAHTPSDPSFLTPDPAKQWKTLTTPHFRINHEAAHKEYAQHMGAIAERVHNKLSPWLGWRPEEKTEIVILDSVDFSNGAATALPYNQFYIYMPTPAEGEIMDHNPWMEYVFTHEYVHILHLDMAYGSAQSIRDILGRPIELMTVVTFPQIFAPSWVTEGLAVYAESDNAAGYGRLNNAWYEAEMRMEVQRGLRSLTEISYEGYSGSRWPHGQNYLYGVYFFKFVHERYGRDTVVNYIRIYSDNLIPWRMDERSMLIFGKPADVVWGEFQHYLQQRFAPQLAKLKQDNTTRTLYDAPYFNRYLTAANNGDLYFFHDDSSSHPQVRRIRSDGANEYLFEAENVSGLDWHERNGLLLNKAEVCDNIKLYTDLYRWKPGMSAPERMTRCGRYVRATWKPDGQQIAAVQLEQGLSRLVLLDASGAHPEQLLELPQGDTLGQIAWSPDSRQIVATIKRQHTGWNLELFDTTTRQWQQLTLNNDLKVRPHFSKDGLHVYFISDHDKVWNLRRIGLADKKVETLSSSTAGIEEAIEMPDASYRLVEYTAQGQAITSLTPLIHSNYEAFSTAAPKVDALANAADFEPLSYENSSNYSALDTLKPRSWVPFFVSTADQNSYAGVTLYGADVLGFHQWSAVPYYYLDQHILGGYAAYHYLNTLTVSASRLSLVYGENSDPLQYRSDEIRYQAILHHSFNSTERSIYLAAGVSNQHIKVSLTQNSANNTSRQDSIAGVVARYDNTEIYRRGISPADGRRVQFTGESYDLVGKNYYSGTSKQIDWKEYIGLGANHVLYLRMSYARGDDGINPYQLGGEIDPILALDGATDLGRRRFALRGYPSGLAALTGANFGLASAEWRIPLGLYYDGWFIPPLGLGKHSLSLFVDSGAAWNAGSSYQTKTGAGLAWNAETLIGYDLLHVWMTLGIAHGFDQGGGDRIYLTAGTPF